MVPVLRIVGPPGSGKTLLIVSLTEALRSRGHRVASAAPRRDGATVLVLSNGGRATIERDLRPTEIASIVPMIDPSVQIILAEGYDAPEDDPDAAPFPAIEITSAGASGHDPRALATVATEDIEATFARLGPGETNGLVDLVETRVLGLPERAPDAPAAPPPSGWRGLLRRLRP